jgi:hypothetical protein
MKYFAKLFLRIALFVPALGACLEVQPWFGDVYEFHLLSSYAYGRFHKVEGAVPQLTSVFQTNVWYEGLDFSPSPEWSVDADIQLAATTKMDFNFRSGALQARYLWLDDIIGDKLSLATGFSVRLTSTSALHDVSCPSHATADFELNLAMGKELEATDWWLWRIWAYAALGHGNRGSPWVRAIAAIETNLHDRHKLALYADGVNSYGRHTRIDIDQFDGYAKIRNKSIDLGFRYGYRIGVWGTLRFEYVRRLLAKSCPSNVNTWIIGYLLPFSL